MLKQITEQVASWEGVSTAAHRFGGVEFLLGKTEIGHLHQGGLVDIPFSRAIRDVLVQEGHAHHHHVLPDTGWISFYARSEADSQHAVWLFRLSYLQKRVRRDRLDWNDAALVAEIDELRLSDSLLAALLRRTKDADQAQ